MKSAPRKEVESGLYGPVWRKINELIDYMREIAPTAGRGIKVTRTVNGSLFVADIPRAVEPGAPGTIKQYRLKAVLDDSLSCVEFNGTTEGEAVTIAKPYKLRKTPWHGTQVVYQLEAYPGAPATVTVSYNYVSSVFRIATSGSLVENQVIIPRYHLNDLIYASTSENGTGVSSVELVDLNADGRAWGRVG